MAETEENVGFSFLVLVFSIIGAFVYWYPTIYGYNFYPGETEDITDERNKIIAMKDSDPKEYLAAINSWAVERIQRLKDDGWRKAVRAC